MELGVGFVTNFFDTLGIGSFAPTTALFKLKGLVPDQWIPGTLNVGHTPPVILQAFFFIAIVDVEPATLAAMIAAAVVGAWFGAGVVAGWPRRTVQLVMGSALLVAAGFFVLQIFEITAPGGEARGLVGAQLGVAVVGSLILGAFMQAGIGFYAPCMVLVSLLGFIFIRWPHGNRSGTVRVVEDRKGGLEIGLLIVALVVTTVLPIVWLTSGVPAFAEYPLRPVPFALGVVFIFWGLWLFHRSHVDLGTNWSVSLQMRENHSLVTSGVYARIRHPMYSSMFLLGIAQALFLPNWIVGPAYLLGFGALYVFRVKHEERMMLDKFGAEYEEYMKRSGQLFPPLR